uniref:Uncharacterized protein n=1 Tax=Panagrolaimus sp. ES5 TaxID=591445 RepID=A0AC34FW78_9BILA
MVEMAWLAAPYCNVKSEEAQLCLRVLLNKVAKKFGLTLYPVQRLSELETATIFNSCGMTISMSKRLRSLLGDNNIFASANKVADLLKTFDAQCKISVENVEVEDVEVEVVTIENLLDVIKNRYQQIADKKKFKFNPAPYEDKIWLSILGDKGGKSMKLAVALGNQDCPNASDKLLLCGMYDGSSTSKLVYAAFKKMAVQIKDISYIELNIDGIIKKFKVRWFLSGDYEFILQVTGRKSASATHYCFRCMFAKTNPNTFGTSGASNKGTNRETFEVGCDSGQEREPLFTNISPNQIVLPSLHIFMGIVTMLLEKLEIYLKQEDFNKLTTEQREEVKSELESADEELKGMKQKLKDNELLIAEMENNLEILEDIGSEYKDNIVLPNNKKQRNRCNMEYCEKRAGYSV